MERPQEPRLAFAYEQPVHHGVQRLIRDLNRVYSAESSLWEMDGKPTGFQWIDDDNAPENIVSFIRKSRATGKEIVRVGNFSPVVRQGHRLGLPKARRQRLLINTDLEIYGGKGVASQFHYCRGDAAARPAIFRQCHIAATGHSCG